ncbi:MAG: hypothetical protein R6X02_25480 [Enhygromyxa sp.]
MAASNSLVLQHSYRHLGPEAHTAAEDHLSAAADALHMALLTLDGSADDERTAKHSRVATARHILVEAVTALARARVYVPGIRTYTVNIVTNSEPDLDRELTRLHELATALLWRNHSFLPARVQAQPLAPEDEAQLAAVVRELGIQARIDRMMRHKWLIATAVFSLLAPAVGLGLVLLAVISAAAAAIELARASTPLSSAT